MRWKAFWFTRKHKNDSDHDDDDDDNSNISHKFKTSKTPPTNIHLKAFENELYNMIRDIKFTSVHDQFQSQLCSDARDIRSSQNVLMFADKSTNLYEVSKDDYSKVLNDNITKTYKKTHAGAKDVIDCEAKGIATTLGLCDRMDRFADSYAFVSLKDHKTDFHSNPKYRLINPAKGEMGHVSKIILQRVVATVPESTQLNQWRNTSSVIDWFTNLADKKRSRFIKFDICDFYPSISEALFDRAVEYARSITTITDEELSIIKHARKSLLFSNAGTWVKKDDASFDVTMGSFDGAEVCELVGLYLLSRLDPLIGSSGSTGLYRDDGLAAIKTCSARRLDKLRKDINELFKSEGLAVTIECNLEVTDFLTG